MFLLDISDLWAFKLQTPHPSSFLSPIQIQCDLMISVSCFDGFCMRADSPDRVFPLFFSKEKKVVINMLVKSFMRCHVCANLHQHITRCIIICTNGKRVWLWDLSQSSLYAVVAPFFQVSSYFRHVMTYLAVWYVGFEKVRAFYLKPIENKWGDRYHIYIFIIQINFCYDYTKKVFKFWGHNWSNYWNSIINGIVKIPNLVVFNFHVFIHIYLVNIIGGKNI